MLPQSPARWPRSAPYPEVRAGGFSAVDGTVEFYGRVNALLGPGTRLLDFGAGRGRDAVDDEVDYRRGLRLLRGKVSHVVGADIDPIVATNPSIDSAVVLDEHPGRLPFRDTCFDVILADFTFEHLGEPAGTAREFDRVLKPGGWICARTPNRWGYIGVGARALPNKLHRVALRALQPDRKPSDVFPTRYQLNTRRAIGRAFPPDRFRDCSYFFNSEPAYFGSSPVAIRVARATFRFLPTRCSALLLVFLQKQPSRVGES